MEDFDPDAVSAQDVIDALRMAMISQKDAREVAKLVAFLLEYAPETDSNRGIDLLLHLLTESRLKVAVDA